MDCVRQAAQIGLGGLKKAYGWEFDSDPLLFIRTCDHGSMQSDLLSKMSRSLDNGKVCNLFDLMDRLPEVGRNFIHASAALDGASVQEKPAAHASIQKWIQNHRSWLFTASSTCCCLVHGGSCKVLPHFEQG